MKSTDRNRPSKWAVGCGWAAALPLVGLGLLGFAGSAPETSETPTTVKNTPTPTTARGNREIWEVQRMGGVRVGYARTTVRRQTLESRPILRTEGLSRMKFERAGQRVELAVRFSSSETPDGRLLEFDSQILQGSRPIQQSRGRVQGAKLEIEVTTQGKRVTTSIPWADDYRGPFGTQQTLWRDPMQPGQRRTIRELVPGANVVGVTELAAGDYEPVEVLGTTHRLLRIDTTTTFPDGQRQRGTLWTDDGGDAVRSRQEAMNLESFRAPKAVALEESDQAAFDLVLGLSVKVGRRLPRPHETTRIRYRLQLEGDDPADVFASGPSQQVRAIDPHSAEVTVYAVRPDRPGNPQAPDDPPGDDDLKANHLIQSDNPQIVALAGKLAGDQKDPWQTATALERYVRQHITATDYSQAFATAGEVVQSRRGDCTEHAVLLAALARARGIPARVAIGLVYTEETGGPAFGYHMWNEMYVGDRWIPLDATLGRGGTGAAHLKLTDTSLEGASAFSSFLPVAQVAGRLQIEIQEVQ